MEIACDYLVNFEGVMRDTNNTLKVKKSGGRKVMLTYYVEHYVTS